jgi:hypothetical protein
MAGVSLRNREKIKKKAACKIPRDKPTRNQGNTSGVRSQLKKQAGKNRAAAHKAKMAQGATA